MKNHFELAGLRFDELDSFFRKLLLITATQTEYSPLNITRHATDSTASSDRYELIDFGGGRKLERFGQLVLDRPSPAAEQSHRKLRDWYHADLRLNDRGEVIDGNAPDLPWQTRVANILFNLRLTPFGHVGIFPEQADNWAWLQSQHSQRSESSLPRALNLFAYTGGSTFALAKAGFEVVHVDASAPSVSMGSRER